MHWVCIDHPILADWPHLNTSHVNVDDQKDNPSPHDYNPPMIPPHTPSAPRFTMRPKLFPGLFRVVENGSKNLNLFACTSI